MGRRRQPSSEVNALYKWFQEQSLRVKIILGASMILCCFIIVNSFLNLYVASKIAHAAGILALIYKLTVQKSCAGLSLKTQELTAIFLVVRIGCSLTSGDTPTKLASVLLVSTLWVIYMMRFKLESTYNKNLDNMSLYPVVLPCAITAILIHSGTPSIVKAILWSFELCLETVSVLPQLRLMQNAKVVESFTAHYVFALGAARILEFAGWMIQIYTSRGAQLLLVGTGNFWMLLMLLAELVHSFILADFCYLYVKSAMVQRLMRLRVPV